MLRWVKKEPDGRSQHLPQLLSLVRLPLLTPQYLADRVATEELVKGSHKCRLKTSKFLQTDDFF